MPFVTGRRILPVAPLIAVLFTNHWLLLADEESKSPTFCVMTGFGGFGVTDKVMALVVIVTGDTHFALDDSIQLITSPFAGVANVMEVCPPEPGIIIPFLYQLITGDKPGLELVSVKTAASPEHNEVLGVAMDAVCVIFGETRTVIAFELTVAGVAQLALLVSLQVIISLLFNPDKVIVVCPLVPGIATPFLNQLITGEVPPLFAERLKVAD